MKNELEADFWDQYFTVYDTLNELIPYRYLLKELVDALDLQQGESVIDVGVGTGNVAAEIFKRGGVPTGIDISPSGIRICEKKLPSCNFVVGDLMEPLPFEDDSFDKAVSNNVLYAIPQSERKLLGTELFRVVRPGGRLVLANIAPGFKPLNIYISHIKDEISEKGLGGTLYRMVRFIIPTLKILRYNALIQRNAASQKYDYLSESDQESFLKDSGFIVTQPSKRVYANNAVLTVATKPL